jgi:fatty acid CoA ligase FadD32
MDDTVAPAAHAAPLAAALPPAVVEAQLPTEQMLLVHRVRNLATTLPDSPGYTFVDYVADPQGRRESLPWAEVDRRARAVAVALRSRVIAGERAAVLAPQGLDYVVAMLGAFYARVVAVPLFPPDLPGHRYRLAQILADARPACVLTTTAAEASVSQLLGEGLTSPPRHVVAVDQVSIERAGDWRDEKIGAADLAYLQYTSGSTRLPAGVMITHGCLTANAAQISAAMGAAPRQTTTVSWLPLFHDMGFMLTVAMPIAVEGWAVFMDPAAFLLRPVRWLQLASGHPNVFSAGPNFAYEYCVARVTAEERATLDLSRVRALLNGAEPVRSATLRDFARAFAGCGLPPEALTPAYGLAEATVYVASGPPDRAARTVTLDRAALQRGAAVPLPGDTVNAVQLVSCGRPAAPQVAIVDPQTALACPPGRVGEIWVNGPNVAPGYFRRRSDNTEVFDTALAVPAEGLPRGGWLRTGDTGVMHDGELLVTGRMKDLIIIDGRNHYPHDIEATVQGAHPLIRQDRVAAFATRGEDGERLVVVAERARQAAHSQPDPDGVMRAVRASVSAHHGVGLHDFRLVAPGKVPRTSSGKIARSACRERYLAGAFAGVRAEPADPRPLSPR